MGDRREGSGIPACEAVIVLATVEQACDNGSGPGGAGNTDRGLTHSLDLTKEGLMPDSTTRPADFDKCEPGFSMLSTYQQEARRAFEIAGDTDLMPWAWILTSCETDRCMNVSHMFVHAPTKIAYPPGVCVYCGLPAGTKDHLLPEGKTGAARRIFVAIVPACGECNSTINDFPDHNIDARREVAHKGIRRRKRKTLEAPDHDLRDYGPNLRKFIVKKQREKAVTLTRLEWPTDPFYDLRAFQKSGIEDPIALGLCSNPTVRKEAS